MEFLKNVNPEILYRVLTAANLLGETEGMPGNGYTYFPGPPLDGTDPRQVGIYRKPILPIPRWASPKNCTQATCPEMTVIDCPCEQWSSGGFKR